MKTIWKFPVAITAWSDVMMPAGAKPLTVQMQFGQPTMWAEVETSNKPVMRKVYVVGTGHPMGFLPETTQYLGTVQDSMGFVWHVFVAPET